MTPVLELEVRSARYGTLLGWLPVPEDIDPRSGLSVTFELDASAGYRVGRPRVSLPIAVFTSKDESAERYAYKAEVPVTVLRRIAGFREVESYEPG